MIECYIGLPRCGKTTYLTALAEKYKNRYRYIYSNVKGCQNTLYLSPVQLNDLGLYTLPDHSLVLIDEAGIQWSNRSYKSFPLHLIEYFKLHGHYKVDFIFFSQFLDFDVVVQRLVSQYYYIKRLGEFSLIRPIDVKFNPNKEDGSMGFEYSFIGFWSALFTFRAPFYLCFRPKFYGLFDSWECPVLPLIE